MRDLFGKYIEGIDTGIMLRKCRAEERGVKPEEVLDVQRPSTANVMGCMKVVLKQRKRDHEEHYFRKHQFGA